MNTEINKYHQKLIKRIDGFSGKFMSDTKWTKVFKILSQNSALIHKCLIKDIWNDRLTEIQMPELQYFDLTFHSKGIKDVITSGPIIFKEIQWLELPSHWLIDRKMRNQKLEPHKYKQDILEVKSVLDTVGQLETEINEDKLIIYAYKS